MTVNLKKPAQEYFEGQRSDVADLVPLDCRRVLDVGCGYGGLGRSLQARGIEHIFGVEINADAASRLNDVYSGYWIGDVEHVTLPADIDDFDCIVFADVLEHLRDPWGTLQRYLQWLKPGGYVVVSVPNVRNLALLYRLIVQGHWEYENSGLLDRTHLRFFTRHSIVEMLEGAGLTVERWSINRDGYTGVRKAVASVAKMFIPEIDVCQYLVVARKS